MCGGGGPGFVAYTTSVAVKAATAMTNTINKASRRLNMVLTGSGPPFMTTSTLPHLRAIGSPQRGAGLGRAPLRLADNAEHLPESPQPAMTLDERRRDRGESRIQQR